MAVPEQTPYIEHTGNGVTTSFALKFQCESKDHLIVLVDEIEPPIATWSLTGGSVVFTTAPAAGKKIKLQRNTPFNRTAEYQSFNNSFRPQTVNIDFDRIWWKLQELGVADWLMKLYVDRLHQQQEEKINDLKGYVDDRDDELRAYLMEEIRKQGVALDQLDDYYNYLMQRLAQIAVDKGWDASFVVSASNQTQQEINDYIGADWRNKAGGYGVGDRVRLMNGDIVKSTVDNNTANPNLDMTGWTPTNDSRQIKFKHTALFSVMRSLSDRLTDIASVKDFGAVGDGVTDDSAAINAAYESGAGIIIFPAGSYLIKSSIFPKSNTHTIGPKAKIIYHKEYANLTIEDAHNVTIESLTIDGNQFEWESWQGCGLNIFKSESITIRGCEIYNAANSGINIGQVSTDPNEPINSKILIDNCFIHDIGTAEINSFYAYGNGIAVVRGRDVVIRNNFIDKIYDIGGINLEGLLQDNIILEGNRITNLTGNAPAIKLWAGGIDDLADYVIIKNNIISNVYGGGGDWGAIHVKSAGNSLTIDNNKIYDCQSDGIVVTSAMDLTISNNAIKNSKNARLYINTASKVMNITGNYIGYADGSTAPPSWIETQGVTGSIANISNNTVENAPSSAFRLVFRNPGRFTNNTIIRPNRSSGSHAIAFGPSTLSKSIIGNNSFIDPNPNSNRLAFYDFSGNHPDMVYLPDSWDIVQGQQKFDLTANNAFIQSCIAIKKSPPTEGYNEQGRILYNADPAANAVTGWMCTASGTPGTWKAFGQLV